MQKRISLFLLSFIFSLAWYQVRVTSAGFGDVSSGHPNKVAIDYVQSKGIVNGYPDGTYQPDRILNRAEFTKIIVESRFTRLQIDSCIGSEGFYKRSLFSDVAPTVWYEKYVCVGKMNGVIGGYPDGTFRGEQSINYAEAAKILVNSYGFQTDPGEPWFTPFLNKLDSLGALPISFSTQEPVQSALREVTRGEMAELIYRLRSTNDTIVSPDGSFRIKIPEKALPVGVSRQSLTVVKVPNDKGPVEEIHGAPMVFYRLEPDGIQFREPVRFEVRTPTLRNTIPMVFLVSGDTFDMIPDPVIEIDQAQETASLSGELNHFSHFGLGFVELFQIRTEPVEQQEKNQPFVITARITRNDAQNNFYYRSAQETITVLNSWILSNGVLSSDLNNIFPQVVSDLPSTSFLPGPKMYTASKMFACTGVFPSIAQFKYQTGISFTYTKSKGAQTDAFSTSFFVFTKTNAFPCVDTEVVSAPIIPEVLVNLLDPKNLNCPGADYPLENEPSIAVEVLKLAVNGGGTQQCFIEPDLQFGPAVGPDNCSDPHYHGGPAYDLQGFVHNDPHSDACGFARENQTTRGIITISQEQYEGMMQSITPAPSFQVPSSGGSPILSGSHVFLEKFIMSDACAHDAFIGLSSTLTYEFNSTTKVLTVNGSTSSGAFGISGTVLPDKTFTLAGSAVVAGVDGTSIELEGTWNNNAFESTKITFGSNGVLPGGCPISYGLVFP